MPRHTIDLTISKNVRDLLRIEGITHTSVRAFAKAMLAAHFKKNPAALSIALIDDIAIQELNRVFRHKDKATDVLSFSMQDGEKIGNDPLLGDIAISLETASRQAKKRRRSLEQEIKTLLIHGFCHLLGYDHETDDEHRVMKAKERAIAHDSRMCQS